MTVTVDKIIVELEEATKGSKTYDEKLSKTANYIILNYNIKKSRPGKIQQVEEAESVEIEVVEESIDDDWHEPIKTEGGANENT